MNEICDRRLAWQPDIYQRYAFLSRLTEVLLNGQTDRLTLLDVGSGPAALAQAFISPTFQIVRADVSQFGDPTIVPIRVGEPLPFEDGAFDVAVAIEVLEHVVPAHRPGFVRELERVARHATILSCPVASPETVEAERDFSDWARAVTGREVDFLTEHRDLGLPETDQVASWFRDPSALLVAENAPLDEWLAFNLIDFLYACDLGDGTPKRRFAADVNARTQFARSGAAHYRRFFCSFASPTHAAAARRFIETSTDPKPASSQQIVRDLLVGVLTLRQDLRGQFAREEASIRAHVQDLEQVVERFGLALADKDAHIQKLDALVETTGRDLTAISGLLSEKDARLQDLDARQIELKGQAIALQEALAERTVDLASAEQEREALGARVALRDEQIAALESRQAREQTASAGLAAALRAEVGAVRDQLRRDANELSERRARLDEATRKVAALEGELRSIVTSRSWRLTSPFRRAGSALRRTATTARAMRRLKAARRWLRERATRRQSYAAIAASGLFDPGWYRERYPDVAAAGVDPLVHYLKRGAAEGRNPHPLFDAVYYTAQTGPLGPDTSPLLHYITVGAREKRQPHPLFDPHFYEGRHPDVGQASVNPLTHYYRHGGREGRDPHPLFASSYYLDANPDVAASGINPLAHYLACGAREGRNPHPLFDASFYTRANPDVDVNAANPVVHYLLHGGFEGRDPHPLFDSSFYLQNNPDVAAVGMNPLAHYLSSGGLEGRDPHPHFDSSFYLSSHPDVAAVRVNPLVHYVLTGRHEGRATLAHGDSTPAAYVPPQGRLPWFNPLNVVLSPGLADLPRLNVLVPGLAMRHLSGGPNTAIELAGRLALAGVRVRLMSTDAPLDDDPGPFWGHLRRLLGADLPATLELVSAHDRSVPIAIGERDVFMATAWWTAQQAKYAIRLTKHSRFVYLIQDYEPLLHPASTQQALANETYALDHVAVVNSRSLHDFLVSQRIGRFADAQFVERSLVFQPAVDRALFFPALERPAGSRRRLLFYARPTNGLRNLFELGVAALEKAVADGTLDPDRWEFLGMGESFPAMSLGRGALLVPAPWLDLAGYARQMRESDILVSLMLSPHPSYPPLEMSACGGLTVTTAFANKDGAALAGLSPNIIGVAPTLEGISEGLGAAVARIDDVEGRRAGAAVDLPASWRDSLADVVPQLLDELALLQGSPTRKGGRSREGGGSIVATGFGNWPRDEYEAHRLNAFARRRTQYPARPEPGLISLLTPVWNSPPAYLDTLADSVVSQDAEGNFEWIVLDNGSDDPGTKAALERLRREPCVRFHRSERNLGIIEGTRFCLEHAANRYTATVDHDDLLTPDCIRVVSHALRQAGYPPLAYTDEDKLDGDRFSQPYLKPQFDPVLFANSCYIAHLSIVDRALALQLGAYTDRQAEGSHDWDTFTRFVLAGHTPVHIPEVLYSWRLHQASTAGNIRSKPFVYDSQRRVLTKLLAGLSGSERFRLEPSPLFGGTPDWWMRRDASEPRHITTVVVGSATDSVPEVKPSPGVPHEIVRVDPAEGTAGFARVAARAAADGRLLHVVWHDTRIVDDCWALEAMGLVELYPDTVMVGGRLHQNGRIVHAGAYFGFGRGCDAPDRGRPLDDPGYFAQAWKPHSVSAVALDHSVLDAQFAADALATRVPSAVALDQLGAWLGAAARRMERRVVYTPFLSASPGVDRGSYISAVAREAFRAAHRDLMPDPVLRSPHAALKRGQAIRPSWQDPDLAVPGEPEIALSYEQQLAADRLARGVAEAPAARELMISVLTSVYEKTPVEFFRQTAASLLAQTHAHFEWVLLENGPISRELGAVLDEHARDRRVQRFACPVNVGIQGAMRACLERAHGDYVVPLDADDLVEPDALAVMASAIVAKQADFVFSDEDHLTEGRLHARYSRPGFDPVLNLESSYVWHLTAFSRERALAVGVYTDPAAEYCHDWDTITRFTQAGAVVAHVPHVLYHWRSHEASSSHRATQQPGSIASTRAVLERVVAEQASPLLYEIAEYPIDRGAVEWWIRRRPTADPSVGVVVLGAGAESDARALADAGLSFARNIAWLPCRVESLEDWRAFGQALSRDVELLVVLDQHWQPVGEHWLWEAIKWFELQPDTAIVGGRLVDDHDLVIDAGVTVSSGGVTAAYRGLRRTDPGAFALALKPQTIHAPASGCFVARREFLQSAADAVLRDGCTAPFALTLGKLARDAGRRVVYTSLVEARPHPVGCGRALTTMADRPALAPLHARVASMST